MTIDMQDDHLSSVEQLVELIKTANTFGPTRVVRKDSTKEIYQWMSDVLIRLKYRTLRKRDKGIVRKYLTRYSGYTKSHVDHLIARFRKKKKLVPSIRTQPIFKTKYTSKDITVLAEVAEAYSHQNGKALCATMRHGRLA